ncbi:MAG: hypothetical protein J0H62_06845 [Rhizobiales bacterium]|nr:hypothetical protein [Hyphomicrobiales bacterium]
MRVSIAAAVLSLALTASAAHAQPGWYRGSSRALIPPDYAMASVRAAGLRPVSPPSLVGRTYVVDAIDDEGDTRRVHVDASFGDVVRISGARYSRQPRVYGIAPPRRFYSGEEVVIRPPAPVRRWRDIDDEDDLPIVRAPRAYSYGYAIEPPVQQRPAPARPQQRREGATATVTPPQKTPAPRSRPNAPAAVPAEATQHPAAAEPKPAATAAKTPAAQPAETPAKTTTPRVILEGGPTVKQSDQGATRTPSAAKPPAAKTPAAKTAAPAAEPAAAPVSKPVEASKTPPAQTLE